MSRNKLDRIKAAQIADAAVTGFNPYETDAAAIVAAAVAPLVKFGMDKSYLSHYQSALDIDLGRIKAETTLEGKQRVKTLALPTYLDFVQAYVKQGDDYPNDVAVQVMIWLLDTGDIELGLNLALHLIKQGQKMPQRFDRDMREFLCDFFYDWANALLKAEHSASPYLDVLIATAEKDQWDLHPLFISKLCALLAKHKMRSGDYAEALALCKKAEQVNPTGAGVKKLTLSAQAKLNQLSKNP